MRQHTAHLYRDVLAIRRTVRASIWSFIDVLCVVFVVLAEFWRTGLRCSQSGVCAVVVTPRAMHPEGY